MKGTKLILKEGIKESFKEDVGSEMGFNDWIGVFPGWQNIGQNRMNRIYKGEEI